MVSELDYSEPGPLTDLDGVDVAALELLPGDPIQICRVIAHLVIEPGDAELLNLPVSRMGENQIRSSSVLLQHLLAMDSAQVTEIRLPVNRVIGTCRHFAVLSCALMRHRGVASRVRCGFATYFQHGRGVDHWIAEYLDAESMRWIRVDPEILGQKVMPHAHDLRPEDFFTGGEAWTAYRLGEIDPSKFGVHGTQNWGPAEIRGNAVKDLAAMNKIEMLPWDEWGRMTDAYAGKTDADYDLLLDEVAAVCAADDPVAVLALYDHSSLRVPENLIS